jgi:hypothetical protein
MTVRNFLRRAGWCGALGGLLLPAAALRADGDLPQRLKLGPRHNVLFYVANDENAGPDQASPAAEPVEQALPSHWIGLSCDTESLSPVVRSQLGLPEDQGLVVLAVVEGSPAAKAGVKENDILLMAGDKALSQLGDLVEAVQASADKELKLELFRGGQKMSIAVTPEKRPEGQAAAPAEGFDIGAFGPQGEQVMKWLRQWRGGENQPRLWSFAVPRPGMLLPPGASVALPKDMSVTITKTGDEPAKIVVSQGDKTWETTEDKLDALPEDVRGHVSAMLGRHAFNIELDGNAVARPEAGVRVLPPRAMRRMEGDFEARFDELRDQMKKLQEAVEQLQKQHTEVKQ